MNVIEAAGFLSASASDTDEGIKQSWRWSASKWHPDRGGDHEAMQKLNAAKDYLLSMAREARRAEKKRLARQVDGIIDLVWAEMDKWEARLAARASVTNTQPEQPKPGPSVTNKGRRAAGWEARNQEKVREQTKARVMNHRSRNPEQYREYMRESMQKKRARQAA